MVVGVVVALTALFGGLVAFVVSNRPASGKALEHERERFWLVRALESRPRIADFVERRLDPTAAGGLLLTVGFVVALAMAVLVGVVLNMVDEETGFAAFDMAVAEFGASQAGTTRVTLQDWVTRLGGTSVIIVVTLAVAIWGWRRYDNPNVALFVLVVVIGQALLNSGLKWLVGRDRPDLEQLTSFSGSSFPSGHSAAAAATYAAVALVVTLHSRRRIRAAAAAIAALIAFAVAATRALLGVHWLTDVIAGLAVGFAWFIVVTVAFGGRFMQLGEPAMEVDSAEVAA